MMNHSRRCGRDGSIVTLMAVLLPVVLILAAYAINTAHIELTVTQVQIATDSAARSAALAYIQTADRTAALTAARLAADRNRVGDASMPIAMADLEFGLSARQSLAQPYTFVALTNPNAVGNAVRVTTRTVAASAPASMQPTFPLMGNTMRVAPLRTATSTQATMDLVVVIDRSGSMAYASDEDGDQPGPPRSNPGFVPGDPVPPGSRWLDTVAAMGLFLDHLRSSPQLEKVALSTYSLDSTTDTPLTFNYDDIETALIDRSARFDGQGTAIGRGMLEGLAAVGDPALSRPFAIPVMVLLTDGRQNWDVSPESIADQLRTAGVTLFTITFSDEADIPRMDALARRCGGENFHADNAAGLRAAFDDIARSLPSLLTQ